MRNTARSSRRKEPAWPWTIACAIAVLGVLRLWTSAARGTFGSDECFHAAAMHALHDMHALPRVLPQFYSGFRYFYHPAFHVLGAVWLTLFGERGLHVLPAAITSATLALLLSGVATGTRTSGAWAALALLTVVSYTQFGTRLYADGLVVLMFAALSGAWCALMAAPTRGRAAALGALAGIALLAKFTALLWLVAFAAGLIVALLRRERARAEALALACVLAVAITLPWWWRNSALFGSAFYPAGAPDVDRALQALNTHRYSDPPLALLWACVREAWLPFALAGAARFTGARRSGSRTALLIAALFALGVSVFGPYAALRHLDAFVVVVLIAATPLLAARLSARASAMLTFLLAAAALTSLLRMDDPRADQEPPAELAPAFQAVRTFTPQDARLLSLWTYDTAYHTGRQATWPIPWGQEGHPVRLFRAPTATALVTAMDEERIGWLLVPTEPDSGAFDSANHPADFMARLDTLLAQGLLREAWSSDDLRLLGRTRAR